MSCHLEQSHNFLGVYCWYHKLEEWCWLDWIFKGLQHCLVMHEFELLCWVNEILIGRVNCWDLMLRKEVSHHVVEEAHSRGLEMATESPEKCKCKEGTQWT